MTIRDISVAFGIDVDRASQTQAENSIKGLKNMATKLLGKVAVVFSVAKLASFAKDCVEAASDVEEMVNKFNTVFDNMADEVDKWAEDFANSVGRNKNTIKTYLADQQNLLVGFGMTREEGAKLSEEMTTLALDLASFSNQDEDVAVNAMTKAVMGESEAAKTLGAVLNDTTRAETMQALGLQGTYQSLSQLEKMQVNYQAILRQSPDAVGDCVRSMGSYESSTRQLKAAQEEFKEFVGDQLLPVMAVFVQWVTKGIKAATSFAKAILLDAEGNNRIMLAFERVHAVVKRLQPAVERFTSSMRNGINRAVNVVKNIVDKIGGMENAIKILALAAGAFLLVMNWGKIIKGAKAFLTLISGIGKLFSLANLKILAVVAIIVILALIVEDFINFLLGNDSVMGTIFDNLGIGADNARQTIFNVFNKVKEFLLNVWDVIFEVVNAVFNAIATVIETIFKWIQAFWNSWGSEILSWFKVLWDTCGGILGGFLDIIKGVANFISSVFTGDWQGAWNAIKSIFQGVWDVIVNFITAVWETIKLLFSMALSAISALWEGIWNGISSFFQGIWNGICSFFQGAINLIMGIISPIAEFFTNIFQSAWDGICSVFSGVASFFQGIWDSIVGIFTSIGTAISDAISGAVKGAINGILGGAAKIINGFISSINFAIGIINAIPGVEIGKLSELSVPQLAEGGIATKATEAVIGEGSEPEAVIPLSKLGGMISGYIKNAKESDAGQSAMALIKDMASQLSNGISAFGKAATASPVTAAKNTTNNSNSSVTQNVEINNSYSGGDKETQKNVSKAMNKSATDATTQMARGLAYARG